VSRRLHALVSGARQWDPVAIVLRATIALGVVGAVVATAMPAWDAPEVYLWIAVIGGIIGVVAPDAAGATVATAGVVLAWAAGGPGGVGPAVVVTALFLLVVHVASALAAAMPITARAPSALLGRWIPPTGVIAAGTVVTAGIAAAFDRWSPPGSLVLVLIVLAALGGAVWWWTD
jgi:hypothetical protein